MRREKALRRREALERAKAQGSLLSLHEINLRDTFVQKIFSNATPKQPIARCSSNTVAPSPRDFADDGIPSTEDRRRSLQPLVRRRASHDPGLATKTYQKAKLLLTAKKSVRSVTRSNPILSDQKRYSIDCPLVEEGAIERPTSLSPNLSEVSSYPLC